jgi:peptidyl-prolyl cis-trans isomerase D
MALKYLRDNLKSLTWILWGVVGVFIMLVFFQWGGVNDRRTANREVAATVGSEEISYSEFRQQYQNLEARYRQTFGEQFNSELAKQFNLPIQALDQLIDRRILLMEARNVGLRATDSEVRDAVLDLPVFKDENGKFVGAEKYQQILRANRLSYSDFEDSLRNDVLLGKLNSILAQTAYVSDAEVEKSYRDQAERAEIRFVQLPAAELASEVKASREDVESYFADHQTDYELPEQRVVDYLLFDTVKLRREIEIPDEELRAYYDSHTDDFSREEQVRARHILLRITPDRPAEQAESELAAVRRRIEAGEDFAKLAQEVSEDESNNARGGSLGYFGRGRMVPAFEEAAFSAQVGELVGPVKTDFGYHLIEVEDHRAGGVQPFEEVQAAVRARLLGDRVQEIAEAKARDLAERIKTQQLSTDEQLEALAVEEGLTWQTTEPFGAGDNVTGIGRAPEFNAAAFDLKVGGLSPPVKLPRGWAILRLQEIKPPRLAPLEEVEAKVRAAVEQQQQKAAAARRLGEMRAAIEAGGDFAALASELGVEVQESGQFGRLDSISGLGPNHRVIDAALALEEGQWGQPIETDLGAVLFQVTARQKFDPAEFEKEKEATRTSKQEERLQRLVASVIEQRRRDLNPKYDTQVLANFGIEPPTQGG